jgi:hypothetical protein
MRSPGSGKTDPRRNQFTEMKDSQMKTILPVVALAVASFAVPGAASELLVASRGERITLQENLAPEGPTAFVFTRPSSSLERGFVERVQKEARGVSLRLVSLESGTEPAARQYEIVETPTVIVYDRRGRLVSRSSDAEEIAKALRAAAGVTRIDWVTADDPREAEIERLLGRKLHFGILRTMSLQPEYLRLINELARKAHFSEGFLDVRTKELIATHVSALNRCKF